MKPSAFYINDIGNDITSKIRLFADDSLLYLAISTKDDCKRLQQDLDRMVNWTKTWQMIFNPLKCYGLKITKKKKTVDFDWHTQGEVGQAQGMLVSLPPLDMILHFYV
jgi:hypothetical protein